MLSMNWNSFVFLLFFLIAFSILYNQLPAQEETDIHPSLELDTKSIYWTPEKVSDDVKMNNVRISNGKRKSRLERVCNKYNLTEKDFQSETLIHDILWNRDYNFAYCPNTNTGTAVMMRNLVQISHLPPDLKIKLQEDFKLHRDMAYLYRIPHNFEIADKVRIIEAAFSFIFVLHPFVKFTSTYHQKVLVHNYDENWRTIIPKDYTKVPRSERGQYPDYPTFEEFSAYFLTGAIQKDKHLTTFIEKCDLCKIEFDFIGTVKTHSKDMQYVYSQTGLDKIFDYSEASEGIPDEMTDQQTVQYLKQLSFKQVQAIYDFYRVDFEAFGYGPEEYYDGPVVTWRAFRT